MSEERGAPAPAEKTASEDAMRSRIAKRAYELYEERGRADGYDRCDWLQAEQEVLNSLRPPDQSTIGEREEGVNQADS